MDEVEVMVETQRTHGFLRTVFALGVVGALILIPFAFDGASVVLSRAAAESQAEAPGGKTARLAARFEIQGVTANLTPKQPLSATQVAELTELDLERLMSLSVRD